MSLEDPSIATSASAPQRHDSHKEIRQTMQKKKVSEKILATLVSDVDKKDFEKNARI